MSQKLAEKKTLARGAGGRASEQQDDGDDVSGESVAMQAAAAGQRAVKSAVKVGSILKEAEKDVHRHEAQVRPRLVAAPNRPEVRPKGDAAAVRRERRGARHSGPP